MGQLILSTFRILGREYENQFQTFPVYIITGIAKRY